MRKVLSFVLVLSLVLGSFSMAFAATATTTAPDVVGTPYEDAVNVLLDLGVATGFPDGTYRPDDIVDRAQMAVFVINALNMGDSAATAASSSFTDMSGYGWAEGFIRYAQDLEIIVGYGDGTFRPGQTVSYDEASKMLVAALGYTPESLTGSYPASYVAKAKSLGILEGISSSAEGANRGDIAIMIYQTLDCGIGTVDKDGNWNLNATYKKDNKTGQTEMEWYDTMLERLGASVAYKGEYFVVTDAIARDKAMINLYPHIGAFIKAYENKDGDIIAVTEKKSEFLTGSINSSDKFKAGGVEYTIKGADFSYLGDTSKDKGVEKAMLFENGILADDDDYITDIDGIKSLTTSNTVSNVTIAADYSGKTIKTIYSVAVWDIADGAHRTFESAHAKEIKDDQELFGIEFPEDDYGDIDTKAFALMGADSLDDIKNGDVVYVYYDSRDKEVARIEVGTETVTGTVSKVSGDDITVGGKVYTMAAVEDSDSDGKPSAGDEVKFYLDYNGDVYNCQLETGSANTFGIVLGWEAISGNMGEQRVKLFLADRSAKTFTVDSEAYTINDSTMDLGDIVKYGVDKNGEIDVFKIAGTYYTEDASGNTILNTKTKDVTAKGYYDGFEIASNATIFTVNEFKSTATQTTSDYGTTTLSALKDKDGVTAIYAVEKDKITAMLIDSNATSDDDIYGVVREMYTTNTDAKNGGDFLVDGKPVSYNEVLGRAASVIEEKGRDNLYKLMFNASDELSSVAAMTPAIVTTTDNVEDLFSISGRVVTVEDKAKVNDAAGIIRTTSKVVGEETVETHTFTLDSNVIYYIWNSGDNAYKVGKESDLLKATGNTKIKFYCSDEDTKIVDHVFIR